MSCESYLLFGLSDPDCLYKFFHLAEAHLDLCAHRRGQWKRRRSQCVIAHRVESESARQIDAQPLQWDIVRPGKLEPGSY